MKTEIRFIDCAQLYSPESLGTKETMEQTLPQQGVRTSTVHHLAPTISEREEVPAPMPASRWIRTKMLLKNPIVLVGITWVVMAVLLAREIFSR